MGEQSTRRVRRFLVDGFGVHDRDWHLLPQNAPPLAYVPQTFTTIDIGHSPLAGVNPTVRLIAENAEAIYPTSTIAHQQSSSNESAANPNPTPTPNTLPSSPFEARAQVPITLNTKPEPLPTTTNPSVSQPAEGQPYSGPVPTAPILLHTEVHPSLPPVRGQPATTAQHAVDTGGSPPRQPAISANTSIPRPRQLSGSGQIAPPNPNPCSSPTDAPSPAKAASSRDSAVAAAIAVTKRSSAEKAAADGQESALMDIIAKHKRRPNPTSAATPISSLPPLPVRTENSPRTSNLQISSGVATDVSRSLVQKTLPPKSHLIDENRPSHQSTPEPGSHSVPQQLGSGADSTSPGRKNVGLSHRTPKNPVERAATENTSGPSAPQNSTEVSTDVTKLDKNVSVRDSEMPIESQPQFSGPSNSPAKGQLPSDASNPSTSEEQAASKSVLVPTTQGTPVELPHTRDVNSDSATPASDLVRTAGEQTREISGNNMSPTEPAANHNDTTPRQSDQGRKHGTMLERNRTGQDGRKGVHGASSSGISLSSTRTQEEVDVPLDNRSGNLSDTRTPTPAAKNTVKVIKVQMPGVKRPSSKPPGKEREAGKTSEEMTTHSRRLSGDRAEGTAAASGRARSTSTFNTFAQPRQNNNGNQGDQDEGKPSKDIPSHTAPAFEASNEVQTTSTGDRSEKELAESEDSKLTHDQFLGCVKVLARLMRRQRNQSDRLKESGKKVSIAESRNRLLKRVVDKLQEMDASLQHDTTANLKEKVSVEGITNRLESVDVVENRRPLISDDRRARSVSDKKPGTLKQTAKTPVQGGERDSRSFDASLAKPQNNQGSTRTDSQIETDQSKRWSIVLRSRGNIGELNQKFTKWSADKKKMSILDVRRSLRHFSEHHLTDMKKLGNDASEFTEKELIGFLVKALRPSATVIGFLWEELKSRLCEYKVSSEREKLVHKNMMMTLILSFTVLAQWTSLLGNWVSSKWRNVSEKVVSPGDKKARASALGYQHFLSDFYTTEIMDKSTDQPNRCLSRLKEALTGLENRREDNALPLADDREQLVQYLKEGYDTLYSTCLEAWTFENKRKTSEEGADKHNSAVTETRIPRITDDGRNPSSKRKVGHDDSTSTAAAGAGPSIKRRATSITSGTRTGSGTADGDLQMDATRSKQASVSNPSRFVKPSNRRPASDLSTGIRSVPGPIPKESRSSGLVPVSILSAPRVNSSHVGSERQRPCVGRGHSAAMEAAPVIKKKVNWADKLVSGEAECRLDKPEVQTLFNDGYDLLGEENVVQRQAVEERASQMQRGSVIALFGFLRSYVDMLAAEMEGQVRPNPDWVRLPYTPSAVRRMVRERGNDSDQ